MLYFIHATRLSFLQTTLDSLLLRRFVAKSFPIYHSFCIRTTVPVYLLTRITSWQTGSAGCPTDHVTFGQLHPSTVHCVAAVVYLKPTVTQQLADWQFGPLHAILAVTFNVFTTSPVKLTSENRVSPVLWHASIHRSLTTYAYLFVKKTVCTKEKTTNRNRDLTKQT